MRPRDKYLLGGIGIVAVVLGFWMLALSPKLDELNSVSKKVDEKQAAVQKTEDAASGPVEQKVNFARTYATLAKLGKAAPEADTIDDEVPSLLLQINHGATITRSRFGEFKPGEGAAAGAAAAAAPTTGSGASGGSSAGAAATASTSTLTPVTYDVSFDGSFFDIEDMVHYLTNLVQVDRKQLNITGRLIAIQSIEFTTGSDTSGTGATTATAGAAGGSHLSASVTFASYTVPAGQSLLGDTTPNGLGAGGSPQTASSTAPSQTPPSVPPATVVKRP